MDNYLRLESISREEFDERALKLQKEGKYTETPAEDISKIENILDLKKNQLQGEKYLLEDLDCACGRKLTFYDFVYTSLVEQWHSASFVAHTLTGRKYFLNRPRRIRCSNCAATQGESTAAKYWTSQYGCCFDAYDDGPVPP